jgi:hypothetical protein
MQNYFLHFLQLPCNLALLTQRIIMRQRVGCEET